MSPPPAEQFAARIFMGPALRAQPDRRLVDLVRDGYDAAFEEIVRRYRRPLDRFAAAFVGGRSEDVTQDAFSKALLALRGSEAEIELRPWLYRIVRNTALNDLRANAGAVAELSDSLPGGRSAAAEVEAREELRDVMDRLQALPETQRAALVMRELEGLSHEEIAAALGLSGGAARQTIFRARAALREGFGLLVPLPVLRALADHGGEAGAAGAGVALGGGALKAGMATVLIAGAVGAGVAVEHHHGRGAGVEAAEAAPLTSGRHPGAGDASQAAAAQSSSPAGDAGHSHRSGDASGRGGGHDGTLTSLSDGGRSGSGGSNPSGDGSHSGGSNHSGSGSSGPGPSSNSGSSGSSGSGDRHGGSSDDDGGGSHSGSGSGDSGSTGSGDDGGTSGGSGSDDGSGSGGGSSGSGSGEVESEPTPAGEPTLSDGGGSSDSGASGSGSDDGAETTSGSGSTSGSGDLSGSSSTSGSDGSPQPRDLRDGLGL